MDLEPSMDIATLGYATISDPLRHAAASFAQELLPQLGTQSLQALPPISAWEVELSVDIVPPLESAIPSIEQPDTHILAECSARSYFEPESDLMETFFTQLPEPDFESWLHSFDNAISHLLPPSAAQGAMPVAIGMMREHFRTKSGAASPLASDLQHMWYSAPPRLQVYDREMINILLNLAKKRLGMTFAQLMPAAACPEVEEELVMAIAAVGALYCDVTGSNKVAKSCYNDARRIVLAKNRSSLELDFHPCLSRTKTFVMLEIYGLCSGDGRSYEFVEALHGYVLQMLRRCRYHLSRDSALAAEDHDLQNVVEAVHLLECYRVLLLQRPPTLTPLTDESMRSGDSRDTSTTQCLLNLSALLSSNERSAASSDSPRLAIIACLTWFPSPRGSPEWREPPIWKADFVELALSRWIKAQADGADSWDRVLFHMAHINLHSNLGLLQRHAQRLAKNRRTPSEQGLFAAIRKWLASQHFDISAWHAKSLIGFIKLRIGVQHWAADGSKSAEHSKAPTSISEPPHLPFCIYFASVVLWYGCLRSEQDRLQRNLCITNGTNLLSRLDVQVAKNLNDALCDLMLEDGDLHSAEFAF